MAKKKTDTSVQSKVASASSIIHLPVENASVAEQAEPASVQFGAIIKEYRKKANISQIEFGEMLGVSRATVVNWEADKYKPEHSLLPIVCSILGITLDQMFGVETRAGISSVEKRILANFRQLSPVGKKVVDKMVSTMLQEEMLAKDTLFKESYKIFASIPSAVAAGSGIEFSDEKPVPVFLKINDQNRRADAIVRVQGDSMEPVYHSGDYVYFRYADSAASGEDVVCSTADGAVIKRVDDDQTLYSVNPDIPFGPKGEDDHVTILGVVTGIVSSTDRAAREDDGILRELFNDELHDFYKEYGTEDWL